MWGISFLCLFAGRCHAESAFISHKIKLYKIYVDFFFGIRYNTLIHTDMASYGNIISTYQKSRRTGLDFVTWKTNMVPTL